MERVDLTFGEPSLSDLVDRAERGESIDIVRKGKIAARVVPAAKETDIDAQRRAALERFHGCLKGKPGLEGVTAANIADFLYDENGLPA